MALKNIVATPTASNLNTIKYAGFVASRALKHVLYLAELFIFSFHLTHALAAELSILLVEQWVKPRPGGSYLMGRCINGKTHIHLSKNTELESEARYPLCLVGGIKPFPLWQILVHNQLQEHRRSSLWRKTRSAACQNKGSKIAPVQCTHPHVQPRKHGKWKEMQGLPQPELPFFPFLFNRNHSHSQVQPISTVRASSVVTPHSSAVIVGIFDVSFPLLLLRAPYLWDILFFTLELQFSDPCGHRNDLQKAPGVTVVTDSSEVPAMDAHTTALQTRESPTEYPVKILENNAVW